MPPDRSPPPPPSLTPEQREALIETWLATDWSDRPYPNECDDHEWAVRMALFVRNCLAVVPSLGGQQVAEMQRRMDGLEQSVKDARIRYDGDVPYVSIDWCAECGDIATIQCVIDHGSRMEPKWALMCDTAPSLGGSGEG